MDTRHVDVAGAALLFAGTVLPFLETRISTRMLSREIAAALERT